MLNVKNYYTQKKKNTILSGKFIQKISFLNKKALPEQSFLLKIPK